MSRSNIGLSVDLDTDLRTIVVGGPKTGKTTVAQNSEWTAIAHPKQAKDVSSEVPVIIDDFYIQFEQCFGDRDLIDEATRDAFTSLCMRDSGICFTLRPRELDWLLTIDSLLSRFCEFGFDSSKLLCDALFDLVECILDTLT